MKPFDQLKIESFPVLSSTQEYLSEQIKSGKTPSDLVVASEQTAGRGRRGRTFYSPAGKGFYGSFCFLRSELPQEALTPRTALAVREAIRTLWKIPCDVKWVNDLYRKGKKVCGILVQVIGDYAVIGIGINLIRFDDVPPDIDGKIGWLFDRDPGKTGKLSQAIYQALLAWFSADPGSVLQDYRKACFHIGRPVTILYDQKELCGKCIGIDDAFRLVASFPDGIRKFDSGFVSVSVDEKKAGC